MSRRVNSETGRPTSTPATPKDPQWYRDAIFYSLRVRSFYDASGDGIGDFQGLTEKLDYLQDLGATTLWLLPFYPSPLKDDGYDTSNYVDVHPDVGTLSDFKHFLREAHQRGLRVVTELVLNHTSDQHPWFQRARRALPGSPERDFYVWSDTPNRYQEARIIFQDFERSNWTWDPIAQAYFWHRFYSHQPDLNFENKAVKKALFRAVDFWLDLGVDGLRLDAVPYLYEQEGTNCENLPETLEFLRELRAHIDSKYQDRLLLAEANQWPEDAVRYLEGGNKCHMAFHFPIMPRMFMAVHMEDRYPITEILSQTPALHETCQWGMFLRNHDELTLEMVTDEERDYMYEAYGKDPIARINVGIRRRLAPLLSNDRRKIELLNTLLCSLPGTPILYYGDEIGMGDNIHLGDRNGVRTPMQWSADRNAGFSRANPQSLYLPIIVDPENHYESVNVEAQQANPSSLLWWTKRLISMRKQYRVFGRGTCEFLYNENPKVLVFLRELGDERILVVANLSRFPQYVEIDLSKYQGLVPVEVFGRTAFPTIFDAPLVLTPGPHGTFWLSLERPGPGRKSQDLAGEPPEIRLTSPQPNWLRGRDKTAIEQVLPPFLRQSRWFGGKSRDMTSVKVTHSLAVPAAPGAAIIVAEVSYSDASPESYHVPVLLLDGGEADAVLSRDPRAVLARVRAASGGDGKTLILADAFRSPVFCRAMLGLMGKRSPARNGGFGLKGGPLPWVGKTGLQSAQLAPKMLTSEQSNTSVVYGDRWILKMYRRALPGKNADLEIGRFLSKNGGFANTPRLAGSVEYGTDVGPSCVLALAHEFAPGTRDGWEYACEALSRYFETVLAEDRQASVPVSPPFSIRSLEATADERVAQPMGEFPGTAELLGRRTGEMHSVLASDSSDPDFAPESYGTLYQRSVYQSMRNLTQQVLRQVKGELKKLPEDVRGEAAAFLAAEKQILARFEEFKSRKLAGFRIRHHGDYHLGQVLFTGKDFLIIDFEGEPARSLVDRLRKRSTMRDIAGMLRSFHYASASTLLHRLDAGAFNEGDRERLEAWGDVWYQEVGRAFLRGYVKTAGQQPCLPPDPEEVRILLDVFLLEKALYEVSYELNNRPAWLRIPLRGVRNILESEASRP